MLRVAGRGVRAVRARSPGCSSCCGRCCRCSTRSRPRRPPALSSALLLGLRAGDAEPSRFAVGAATLSLLSRAAEDRPLAVLVDDGHLLDGPSAEALVFAARRLLSDAVAVVVAVRAGEPGAAVWAGLPTLRSAGLDVEAAAELVASASGPVRRDPAAPAAPRHRRQPAGAARARRPAGPDRGACPAELAGRGLRGGQPRVHRPGRGPRRRRPRRRCSWRPPTARARPPSTRPAPCSGSRDPGAGRGRGRRAGRRPRRPGRVPAPAGPLGGVRRRRPGDPACGAPGAGQRRARARDRPAGLAPVGGRGRPRRGDRRHARRGGRRRPTARGAHAIAANALERAAELTGVPALRAQRLAAAGERRLAGGADRPGARRCSTGRWRATPGPAAAGAHPGAARRGRDPVRVARRRAGHPDGRGRGRGGSRPGHRDPALLRRGPRLLLPRRPRGGDARLRRDRAARELLASTRTPAYLGAMASGMALVLRGAGAQRHRAGRAARRTSLVDPDDARRTDRFRHPAAGAGRALAARVRAGPRRGQRGDRADARAGRPRVAAPTC